MASNHDDAIPAKTNDANITVKPMFIPKPHTGPAIKFADKPLGKALMAKMTEPQLKRLAKIPEHMKRVYARAVDGNSKACAIKAFCQMCVGWDEARKEVLLCAAYDCPLYPYRPYVKGPTATEDAGTSDDEVDVAED